jgi:hypothetical protein
VTKWTSAVAGALESSAYAVAVASSGAAAVAAGAAAAAVAALMHAVRSMPGWRCSRAISTWTNHDERIKVSADGLCATRDGTRDGRGGATRDGRGGDGWSLVTTGASAQMLDGRY